MTEQVTEERAAFRRRAAEFLRDNVPRRGDSGGSDANGKYDFAEARELQLKIHDAGFGAAIAQPKEYGGHGLGEAEALIWSEESAGYAVPYLPYSVSHGMCGPIINLLGTDAQKRTYLPELWRGTTLFAQMFSEPGAGSDVASLAMRAEKVDGGWVITGQKVWTTNAQNCDFGVVIARTDPSVPKHQGITMFIIPLGDPAVTVRPLRVATGEYPFNEIFIDGLRVGDDAVLSEVGKGWAASRAMLNFERISIGTTSTKAVGPQSFEGLLATARAAGLDQDPATRAALVDVHVLEQGTNQLAVRMREEAEAGVELGARGSIAKLAGALSNLRVNEIMSDAAGSGLAFWDGDSLDLPPLAKMFAGAPSSWTAGGTIEIQKNIVGEHVLGQERDPSVDRGVPFNETRHAG